jgi:predicted flap endonuclease-1-like 5' DNA nuclease
MQIFEGNRWLFLVVIVAVVLVAWWIGFNSRRTRVERSRPADVLDEGAQRAQRNQALIDAPVGQAEGLAQPVTAPVVGEPAPAIGGAGDDLTRIKGLGPKLAALLGSLGVNSFAQIAAWGDADIDRIDAQLGTFAGRIRRDNWVEQAKYLAARDMAGFEGKFGRL